MKTDWFESIFLKINDLSTLFDGEEDPLDVLRYSNEQTKLDWLYQVSESIFLNNEGQRHLEVLSTFKNL